MSNSIRWLTVCTYSCMSPIDLSSTVTNIRQALAQARERLSRYLHPSILRAEIDLHPSFLSLRWVYSTLLHPNLTWSIDSRVKHQRWWSSGASSLILTSLTLIYRTPSWVIQPPAGLLTNLWNHYTHRGLSFESPTNLISGYFKTFTDRDLQYLM